MEAAYLSKIVFGWMANDLEFNNRRCRSLSEEDCTHVYWAISTLTHLIGEAQRIYLEGGR